MADGKWVMTEEDSRRVDLSFSGSDGTDIREFPNHGRSRAVDDRGGKAQRICAFCGSDDLQTGFGGCGEGFGYRSFKCRACGGETDFVYKDEVKRFFAE
jgi:hypothetical protein